MQRHLILKLLVRVTNNGEEECLRPHWAVSSIAIKYFSFNIKVRQNKKLIFENKY